MKKFLSLFCALAIVLSASAAPVSKKDVLAKKEVKKEVRANKALKKAAHTAQFAAFEKKTTKLTKAEFGKATVAKAPQAKKEAIDLVFAADAEYDWVDNVAAGGWWQFQVEDDNYYLSLSNKETEQVAGTYALDDMDAEYSFLYSKAISDYLYFNSCEITLAEDNTDGYKLTVTGWFEATDGNTYNLNLVYEEEPVEPGDFDFVATSESHNFYSSDNDVYFTFRDADDNVLHFDIVVAAGLEDVELDKAYTLDDMLANYSNVTFNDVKADFKEVSFTKTIAEADGAEVYTATATDIYDRVFHLSYSFKAPEALNFETITAPVEVSSEVVLFWTEYTFTAQDEKNAISFSIMPDDTYFGTWVAGKEATGSVFNKETETPSDIYSGEITIEKTADGFAVSGKVLCMNNTEYTLDLTYVIPDKTRDAELTISGLELNLLDGAWQLSGFNEDETKFVSLAAYTDEISGTYTEDDLAADYSYIYTDLEFDEEGNLIAGNQFALLKANLNVVFNEADTSIVITGTFLGQNGDDVPEFTLTLSGKAPYDDGSIEYDAEEDFVRHFAEYEINDQYLASNGVLFISASNEDNEFVRIQVNLPENAEGLVAGEYEVSNSEYIEPGTIGAGSFEGQNIYGSFAGSRDAEGYINVPLWFFASGKVTVSESLVLEVQVLNSKGYKISCRLGTYPEGIENTDAKAAATKRVVNGVLVIEKNGVRYNAQGTVVK